MKGKIVLSTGLLLLFGLLILWLPWLGETLFYSKGEPREAVVALSMLQSGNWILPVAGSEIPYKPPFLAWLIAIFAALLNGGEVNEFISRLPSVIAAVAMIMAGYHWARKHRGEHFALIMALVTATSIEVYRAAVACRVDMVLTACMVCSMYLLHDMERKKAVAPLTADRRPLTANRSFGQYLLVVLLMSCAVLTKGPIGSLLPCAVLGIYFLLRGNRFFPTLGRLSLICLCSFILPALWYYAAYRQGGDGFISLVWEENIGRLTGTMSYESHIKPFWYNFLTLLAGMAPWTLFVLIGLFGRRSAVSRPSTLDTRSASLLAIVAVVVIVLFYCIPVSKRSVYLLPVYPFLAYGVAHLAEALSEQKVSSLYARFIALLGVVVPIAILASHFYPIVGYSFSPNHWWGYLLIIATAAVSLLWLLVGDKRDPISGACLISLCLLACYGGSVMPTIVNKQTDKVIAAQLRTIAGEDGKIYTFAKPDKATLTYCLNYYLDNSMGRIYNLQQADSLPAGSLLIFTNPDDTIGLSDKYVLSPLTQRLADTRHPAWLAIQTGYTAAERAAIYASDSLGTTPSVLVPAGQIIPLQSKMTKIPSLPQDSTTPLPIRKLTPDTLQLPTLQTPTNISPRNNTHILSPQGEISR